jgi:hypothetical protein
MTDKDREAFEGVYGALTDNDGRANHFQQLKFEAFTTGLIAARAESAKEIKQLEADIGGLEDLLKLERDKNTRIMRESDAEIERLKKQISALKECPPRKWTDEEGREWHLLDFGYGTPSDIRLTLRLGTAFSTAEYSIANTKKED